MALGGGNFVTMDKVLPGSYINIISRDANVRNGDRGVAAMGLSLDWGIDDKAFVVTAREVKNDALKLFGYDLDADEMVSVRELLRHARKLVLYKLTSGGTKASCALAEARYSGVRGNKLTVKVTANVDVPSNFDVVTMLGNKQVDKQIVSNYGELKDNDFVLFNKSSVLAVKDSPLTGGTNGTVNGGAHQKALSAFEEHSFNALGLDSTDQTTKGLYNAYTKRMRDQLGIKFQLVSYDNEADYEGIINLKSQGEPSSLVYWLTGAEAGCAIPGSLTNKLYDGELSVNTAMTQVQLENSIASGTVVFHKVGTEVRVLCDVNSLTTFTDSKNEIFAKNETVRVMDMIANKISQLFSSTYIGAVINNQDGRMGLWSDIAQIHRNLESSGVILDWDSNDLSVQPGEGKGDVVITDTITIAGTMEKLYMTVVVS